MNLPTPQEDPTPDGRIRFNLAIQQSRLAVYLMATVLALLGKWTDAIDVSYRAGLPLLIFSIISALFFHELYRRGFNAFPLRPLWMAADVLIVTWGVYLTGGAGSPWFIWYISNVGAAAFTGGPQLGLVVALLNAASYIALLIGMGHITGLDATLSLAAGKMAFLYGASFFFLRGVARLQEQQRLLRRVREDERLKVDELVRLTQDLDQGTRALAEANLQIREADRVKSQFLANMSHELRTPLNSIIGFSEILMERLADELSAKHVKFLANINSSGQHLLAIINDILDLSKVEAGKMEIRPEAFKPAPVVEGVLNVMHGVAGRRDITFAVDAPDDLPEIETDPSKFKQILYNLLSNAVKFSPEHSEVRIVLRCLRAADSPLAEDSLTMAVIDKGIGVAPADQEVIFHEFRQADGSATRQFGGTGLGLALVKKFAEFQGGQVTLDSHVGRGSTFTVTLPLRSHTLGEEFDPPQTETAPILPSASRILVVEDDLVAYQSIAKALSASGYFPIRARHGEEALEMARMLKPTAITLDLALPDVSGWEVLKEIKRDAATRHIPVVIISMMDNRELGITLGAEDYFLKPVDRRALIARLREIAPPRPASVTRLLVIDDDRALHDMLDEELTRHGYTVDHAHSGMEGIELATQDTPDAVVLDLMMPDLTGFEVASVLQERAETAHVPIVLLTAKDLTGTERSRLSGKIAACVQKGASTTPRLVAAIQDLESRHGREGVRVR